MVTVIGPQELQTLQPSSPDDILRFVPNVEFLGGPRRTGEVPSIRGFSGPDVIILFDGARQNYNSGHDGQFFIDPSVLKRSEEHTSELQSLMRNSYAVFFLKKKNKKKHRYISQSYHNRE